jgi:hypothetical protein
MGGVQSTAGHYKGYGLADSMLTRANQSAKTKPQTKFLT